MELIFLRNLVLVVCVMSLVGILKRGISTKQLGFAGIFALTLTTYLTFDS